MKHFIYIILIFFLFQIQSCILTTNQNAKIGTSYIKIDSLIGKYHSTNRHTYTSSDPPEMTIKINKDSSCYITVQGNCTCVPLGFDGKWEVKGRYVFLENYPIRKPILVDSKKTNDKFIIIQTVGGTPTCYTFSNGKFTYVYDNNGFFTIKNNNIDSIEVVNDFPYSYMIYNKETENNKFVIRFFENKSTVEFNYKLKIKKKSKIYSLKGKTDMENFEYNFIK